MKSFRHKPCSGFTLIEMVVVISILTILMVAGVSLLGGTGAQARKASTDAVTGLIEQARSTAITSRSTVILALAEPLDLPVQDDRCRVGLFKVTKWEDDGSTADAVLLRRWQTLETGVVLASGTVEGLRNPVDEDKLTIRYTSGGNTVQVSAHAIAFNSRGGLKWPTGSDPVALRIAEGAYRGANRQPQVNARGPDKTVTENKLKIGRVLGRPYRLD